MKSLKNYFKILSLAFLMFTLWSCSSGTNTSLLPPDEHLAYAMQLYNDGEYLTSIDEFQAIMLQYPGKEVADDAQYYLGMSYFKRGEYILAAYEFSKLIQNIPASDFVPDSQYRLAESYYRLSPPYQLEQKYTTKAIDEFQAFIDFFPTNERVKEAEEKIAELNNKLAEKTFKSAEIYERMSYYSAAVEYYNIVVENYHDTPYAPQALYKKIKLQLDRDNYEDALNSINSFLEKYPENKYTNDIQKLREPLLSRR